MNYLQMLEQLHREKVQGQAQALGNEDSPHLGGMQPLFIFSTYIYLFLPHPGS